MNGGARMSQIFGTDLIIFIVLIFIGIIVLMIIKALIHFVLPLIGAVVVWLYTGSLTFAGVAFLVIAFLELVFKKL